MGFNLPRPYYSKLYQRLGNREVSGIILLTTTILSYTQNPVLYLHCLDTSLVSIRSFSDICLTLLGYDSDGISEAASPLNTVRIQHQVKPFATKVRMVWCLNASSCENQQKAGLCIDMPASGRTLHPHSILMDILIPLGVDEYILRNSLWTKALSSCTDVTAPGPICAQMAPAQSPR